jgi:peptidoglycan L-alanyl-D-glutamate endopeptidase CwlK
MLYYMQGRLDVKNNKMIAQEYNALRKLNGLWEVPISDALFKPITWTLDSKHFSGKAFDIVPLKDGKAWWDAPDELWERIGKMGKDCGLAWGGDFPVGMKDRPHFEDI